MHRKYPKLGGLALGLLLLAAAGARGAGQYSAATIPGLAPEGTPGSSIRAAEVKMAENNGSSNEDAAAAEARKRLKMELDRMRRGSREGQSDSQSGSPKPVKKKETAPAVTEARPQPPKQQPAASGDPAINRAAGKLLIMRFSGTQPSDAGPKAVRAMMHDGLIAGVMFGGENIQAKSQVKELIKFFWPGGPEPRPVLAISEIGGVRGSIPRIKDFEAWPSQKEVASKGDPEYAYSTYRSLSIYLAGLGFTMNFGPAIGAGAAAADPSSSFGANPLQAGVFAKTFVLGHRDGNMISVPLADGSDDAVRALKTLLVSYPGTPLAMNLADEPRPFAAYEGLVRGARFCLVRLSAASDVSEAANDFNRGCDVLVIDGGKDSPATIRDRVAQGLSDAIKRGELTLAALEASAQRVSALLPQKPASQLATQASH